MPASQADGLSYEARLLLPFDRAVMFVAMVLWVIFFATVVLQVLVRYVLELPLPWTEEVARESFIWWSLLTSAVILGRRQHFAIPIFVERLPARLQTVVEFFVTLGCLVFAVVVTLHGWNWAMRMRFAFSPVLELPQGLVYAIIPLSLAYMGLHLVVRLFDCILRLRHPREGSPPAS